MNLHIHNLHQVWIFKTQGTMFTMFLDGATVWFIYIIQVQFKQ